MVIGMPCPDCEPLRVEVEKERRIAKEAQARAAVAYAERRAADATVEAGVRIAIRWIREMPPRELVTRGMRIGTEVYRLVADSLARFLEERVDVAERPTMTTLPRDEEDSDDGR